MLKIGLSATLHEPVTPDRTAQALGSGTLAVYATPAMALLMEKTCCECLRGALESGLTTVGTALDIRHVRATPIGGIIVCSCILEEIDGRNLRFSVECRDGQGVIGQGTHGRAVVDGVRFMARTAKKRNDG